MQFGESIIIALRALTVNKLRTILTMLGIIIGVAAVIGLISIGNGFRQQINEDLGSLGTNVLSVYSGRFSIFGPEGEENEPRTEQKKKPLEPLTIADADALNDPLRVTNVVGVAPEYNVISAQSVGRGQQEAENISITGVTPEFASVRNMAPEVGEFISQEHVDRRARVAVLGARVVEQLFEPYEYPIGETVRINGVSFEIIGLLEEKGQGGFGGDQDSVLLIPLTTAQTRLDNAGAFRGSLILSGIYIQVDSPENMDPVSEQVTEVMRERHRLGDEYQNDFTIINQAQLLDFANSFATGLTAFLGSIAGVSLLVGGIGIMNIMLVSVTERTREIGIRKAVGAKRSDILLQFLVEAIVISLIGGFMGIGLGYGIAFLLPTIIPDLGGTVVTPGSILLATSFSAAIGLFFGVYPATRAARLRPIEALRYE
jgi:putative ABC transport system permease protein